MFNDFCQMASNDFEDIRDILSEMTLEDLIFHTDLILFDLDPYERINYDVNMFCNGYDDRNGRIALLEKLFNDGVISALYLPCGYELNTELKKLLRPIDYSFFYTSSEDEMVKKEPAPLTDDLEVITGQLEISNPGWEHTNDELKTESADKAVTGDLIELRADIKNYPDKAKVTFDIYDISSSTPLRINSVETKNENGIAKAKWTVEDPEKKGKNLKLAFEAIARSKASPRVEVPIIPKIDCDFVEMPDILFHHNSAVPCLDQNGTLISSLCSVFKFAKENSDKEIVLFGHSDTSGDPEYNYDLSQWRAEGIKALLDNKKDAWLDIVGLASKVEDYQQILKSLYNHGWPTDPGKVDNANGPKTKDAVNAFQGEYNNRFNGSLKQDGVMGQNTWSALFEVIRSYLVENIKKDTGEEPVSLNYSSKHNGLYPCGESFPIDEKGKDDYKSRENRRVEIVFFDKGKAPELIKPENKKKVKKSEAVVYDSRATSRKPVKTSDIEPVQTGEIFYDTGSNELGIISLSNMGKIKKEIEWLDAFTPYMKVFMPSEDGNEKDKAAESKAVMYWLKEFVDSQGDTKKAQEIIDTLDQKIKGKKEEILKDESSYDSVKVSGHKLNAGDIKEFYWVSGKRMVRIRSQRIKPHNRWFNKKQVLEQIRAEQRRDEQERENSSGPAKELEVKLFEKELFNIDGSLSPKIEEFNKKCRINFFDDSEIFDADIGAQFLRYSAEAVYGANFNWKEKKTVKVGGKAEGSFSLAQAQGHFDINIPNENGFNFIEYLKSIDERLVKEDCGSILLLLQLNIKGSAFVGACASVSLDIGVSVKEPSSASGGAEAGLDLFAGAKVGADTTLGLKMKLIDDKDSSKGVNPWSIPWTTLADISYGAWAAIGIGIEAAFKLGYYENRFRFLAKVGLVLKGGAGTYIKGSIDVVNGAKLIWTIGESLNWKHMSDVFDDNVHDIYQGLMANCFYTGKAIQEMFDELAYNLDEILVSTKRAAERGLGGLKGIDDTFDEYIPGYSGFKQYNTTFLILKSTYYYLKQENMNEDIKLAAIERVEKAQRENLWKYATWQMKVNLIYDMRYGGAGIGGLTEERKEDAVITVLSSCRHGYEFDKIIYKLKNPEIMDRESVLIKDLLDFKQYDKFLDLQKRYRI